MRFSGAAGVKSLLTALLLLSAVAGLRLFSAQGFAQTRYALRETLGWLAGS